MCKPQHCIFISHVMPTILGPNRGYVERNRLGGTCSFERPIKDMSRPDLTVYTIHLKN